MDKFLLKQKPVKEQGQLNFHHTALQPLQNKPLREAQVRPAVEKPSRQGRLQDCAKVQVLASSRAAPKITDLKEIHDSLVRVMASVPGSQDQKEREEEQLRHLRTLDCYQLSTELLIESQLGPVVRKLRASSNPAVKRIATGLFETFTSVVKHRARSIIKHGQ
mmetsp:Transcript_21888/g.37410  ORF Transcript_21888/g.37410 Transcript_21888/m.37410 type:complete len:163 (+) Transcript_21888:212-700(+)|eukprot:CAMPEP_0119102886 /NCGR_PEP_ID=MMETSP1180-20130426/1487_1 /TAXON_ID=3052 ORGANISM="Chlamydomonas cf sp, Strain CCMP681" /NCGR_SAMPLE_ID=MMETSP1180 /ASSEMBLY_ACC=CAM_ASM_000741 /LENGTH=162 /DNA_ID=CAMNT_0007087263 /DNA_START=212 /DNA_END=700 /DNA_ORIENTATION=+